MPFGYVTVKVRDEENERTKLEPDPKAAPVVERMFQERVAGRDLAPRIRAPREKEEELEQAESEAQARIQNRRTELSDPDCSQICGGSESAVGTVLNR